MDIYCPSCGEPWDLDMLHEVSGVPYDIARQRFRAEGCALFDTSHNEPVDLERAARLAALQDLLGDDLDGIAAELEDWPG